MSKEYRRFMDPRIVVALCLILVGVLMLLDRFGGELGFSPWDLWPLFLVIPGLYQLLQPRETRQAASGVILLVVGGFFLLRNLDVFPSFRLEWSDIWPFLILAVGLVVLINALKAPGGSLDRDVVNLSALMGGGKYTYASKALKGGRISAVMGGYEIDLRGCVMEKESITFDVFALMGGIELRVPPEWEVRMQGLPLLGGMEYKGPHPIPEKHTGVLVVRGMAIMGGVEVKA